MKNAFAEKPDPGKVTPANSGGYDGILDAAHAIAERRREILAHLRVALGKKDTAAIIAVAKELVAYDDKESDRVDQGKHDRTGGR